MELVLWRQADTQDGPSDLKRELTEKGRKQAEAMARWLRPRIDGDWKILVSPAKGAKQTADALKLDFDTRITLGPLATEDALIRETGWPAGERNVIVVGHQPTFGRLAARLLTGHSGDLRMKKGSIWWFSSLLDEEVGNGETLLRAVIAPDFAD